MSTLSDPLNIVGTTIAEKYRVESVVGEGGFAVVYKAMHLVWKRPVAIKAFRALGNYGEEHRQRLVDAFIQEGALLAELSERSTAIVQARDVGTMTTPDGNWMPYMVLEWLEGTTLDRLLEDERARGGPLRTPEQAFTLLEPVADALALAHEKGIAHRDVKPGNVFILGDTRRSGVGVKLLDFGIAKVVQDAQSAAGAFRMTGGNVTSFTPSYGAPEQFSRSFGATGPWTDVYALALIFVEVLSGRAALVGESMPELAYSSCDKTRRPTPRALGVNVPDAVEAVMARALAVAPEERFASAGEMWRALREAVQASQRASASAAPPAPAPPPSAPARSSPGTIDPATAPKQAPRSSAGPALAIAGGLAAIVLAGIGGVLYATKAPGKTAPVASVVASVAPPPPASSATVPELPPCPEGMLPIPGGKFYMGSDDRLAMDNEKPTHQVTLQPYCIDKYEVTVEKYFACSDKGECKRASKDNDVAGMTDKERKAYDPLCNARDRTKRAQHPINCVDWEMAAHYCEATGKRLPTEAEWEFAARGPDGRKYPWGDDEPTAGHLNACGKECVRWAKGAHVDVTAMYDADDGWAATAPVGTFPNGHSRYGVEDVVGNVWEWTADYYAPYTTKDEANPKGPETGDDRVIRGGAWNGGFAAWVRPTFRYHAPPVTKSHGYGFRCAKSR